MSRPHDDVRLKFALMDEGKLRERILSVDAETYAAYQAGDYEPENPDRFCTVLVHALRVEELAVRSRLSFEDQRARIGVLLAAAQKL